MATPKPRALAGLSPLALTLAVTASLILWGLILWTIVLLATAEGRRFLAAEHDYFIIAGAMLVSLGVCLTRPADRDERARSRNVVPTLDRSELARVARYRRRKARALARKSRRRALGHVVRSDGLRPGRSGFHRPDAPFDQYNQLGP